jgi:hypothetical protein
MDASDSFEIAQRSMSTSSKANASVTTKEKSFYHQEPSFLEKFLARIFAIELTSGIEEIRTSSLLEASSTQLYLRLK